MTELIETIKKTFKMNKKNLGYKRTKYFVNKQFQGTFIGFNLILTTALIILLFLENKLLINRIFHTVNMDGGLDPHSVSKYITVLFLGTTITFFCLMWAGGLILSNRVAGPLFRLKKHMRDTIDGAESRPVKFREGDYFQDIAETYNELLEKLKK